MLKVNLGWSQERLALQLAFGLSEGNLVRLRETGERAGPIVISGEDLPRGPEEDGEDGLDSLGFVIFSGSQDQEQFTEEFQALLTEAKVEPDGEVVVMNLDGNFYLTPIPSGDKIIYFLGLHEGSYEKLRAGNVLSFRARLIDGDGKNVEVNLFWVETDDVLLAKAKRHA